MCGVLSECCQWVNPQAALLGVAIVATGLRVKELTLTPSPHTHTHTTHTHNTRTRHAGLTRARVKVCRGEALRRLKSFFCAGEVYRSIYVCTVGTRPINLSSKGFALTWYRALTCYFPRLSSLRTHFEPWKAVCTRGRGSLAAR